MGRGSESELNGWSRARGLVVKTLVLIGGAILIKRFTKSTTRWYHARIVVRSLSGEELRAWMVQRFYISNRLVQLTAQLIFLSPKFQLICINLLVFTWLCILKDSSETLSAGKLYCEELC
ncbi:uncharacterized protein LOC111314288 [Durio zibethinus]|uniref:Uncharacterized protein LOC111314288 n=1 Tax=Durio zibethinus TaxID=66656 RepID=A0A6P6B237_DURZI|nr:uncharacterized protein LOC111314288 [Durio zibethinus]